MVMLIFDQSSNNNEPSLHKRGKHKGPVPLTINFGRMQNYHLIKLTTKLNETSPVEVCFAMFNLVFVFFFGVLTTNRPYERTHKKKGHNDDILVVGLTTGMQIILLQL